MLRDVDLEGEEVGVNCNEKGLVCMIPMRR